MKDKAGKGGRGCRWNGKKTQNYEKWFLIKKPG